jgi:hypothetical protein
VDKLAARLTATGHPISAEAVAKELVKLGYSRQQHHRKADEGSRHPDRNTQLEHINAKVIAAQAAGLPVNSVDTKKKERVGNFKNAGSDCRPKGNTRRVNVHDFEDKELGKVVPYGVYDVNGQHRLRQRRHNERHGRIRGPGNPLLARANGMRALSRASDLTITANCGGSNGARVRPWKLELRVSPTRPASPSTSTAIRRAHPSGTESRNLAVLYVLH